MPPVPTRKPVSKACDACRKRKIKCDGCQPCAGCAGASLACTFNLPRGQGGARATVLDQLRAIPSSNIASKTAARSSSLSIEPASPVSANCSLVERCMDVYITHVYPVVPILDVSLIEAQVARQEISPPSRQFVQAFCAYVSNFGRMIPSSGDRHEPNFTEESGRRLLDATIHSQRPLTGPRPISISVYTSFFLYGACAGLGAYQEAWYFLREATTCFLMVKPSVDSCDWYDEKTQRSLFWILVVSERSHAIRKNRPITLSIFETSLLLDGPREQGLQYLASVFRPFDEVFFSVWNGATQSCSKEWLLQLEYDVRTALPPELDLCHEEIANLRISQCWLQIKLWELFPRYGFLSSESEHDCLTFGYPLMIATSFTTIARSLPVSSLKVHGVGMTEKVFDIACALVDVLPFLSQPSLQSQLSHTDSLTQMLSVLVQLPGGNTKFVPLIMAKVHELLPDLVRDLLAAVDMPFETLNHPMSPNTRFLYEEEVGRGLYTDLRR
ncbi:hypothetical protein HBI70_059190 [Parastagonospora nodorum]|nr:hypothetical protein HBH75_074450 [Parastagonospora nodorum]KAH5060445.1 hypothetical protein HBH96_078590 [Parastagonospora nodorum]KAH5089936.1 hypothetical protein HBI73_129480 [Parastagonospora nodorum]KAH5284546.1 hypothetical protein HBI70_059190 [Parastagonospora nodorum]KAH5435751.1 hypothetical protein HBI32_039220 [Parastagonospora nodorum]